MTQAKGTTHRTATAIPGALHPPAAGGGSFQHEESPTVERERNGADALSWMTLPNGMPVSQVNRDETSLQYRTIFIERCYERHGVVVKPGMTVFDVGANIGMAALHFAQGRDAVIYAFEPASMLFAALKNNLTRHGVRGKAYQLAISDRKGEGELQIYPRITAMSGLYVDVDEDSRVTRQHLINTGFCTSDIDDLMTDRHATRSQPCQIETLAGIIAADGVAQIDLLKINVEKAELDVLRGLSPADWPRIGQIVMQVHAFDDRVDEVAALLSRQGFKVVVDQEHLLSGTGIFEVFAVRG